MARTKQTARKCSGGGKLGRQPPPSEPSDMRPTGKAYLEALRQLAEQSQSPIASQQAAATIAGATEQSVSDTRTALPDLGPDLLQRIFAKLGPHPKDLVPLGAVSKQWRQVLDESTWKELCVAYAEGLVKELGYDQGSDLPPEGWAGLYKLLVYCPGCHFPTFEHVLDAEALSENYDWRHGRGHVDAAIKGFCKGKETNEALYLPTSDEVVISHICSHVEAVEMCNVHEASAPPILACRGFVKRFESSKLAELSGAAAFVSQRIKGEGLASGPAESPNRGSDMLEVVVASHSRVSGCELGFAELDEEDASNKDEGDPPGSKVEGQIQAVREASDEVEESKEKGPPCLYCSSPTLALPRKAFSSRFGDYDDLLSVSVCDAYDRHEQARLADESDESDGSDDDSMYVLGTGFVCLCGHIVLGMAGYPKLDGVVVPHSGKTLKVQRPQAVDFLLEYLVGDQRWDYKEGHLFIQALGLDQLIQIEARLVQLKEVWPVKAKEKTDVGDEEPNEYKLFGSLYWRRSKSSASIVDVLGASVPAGLLKCLQDFVLTGNPSLAECERSIQKAFDSRERKEEEEKARKIRSDAMDDVLRGAGFKYPFFQDLANAYLSKVLKDFVETGNPNLAECERLILEERKMRKEREERTKALELRTKPIYEALRQAGFTPSSVPHQQSLSAYIEDPSAITVEEVVAQQRGAREQRGKCRGVTDGRICTNEAARGCSNGGCGNFCRKFVEICRLGKHKKT